VADVLVADVLDGPGALDVVVQELGRLVEGAGDNLDAERAGMTVAMASAAVELADLVRAR
jgi:hypothetical protein